MKKILVIGSAVVIVLAVTAFFTLGEGTTYHPADVKVLAEGICDHGITLTFRPPPESLFFCPGVTYKAKGHVIQYTYVRSQVDDDGACDIKAKRQNDGSLSVTFPFPNKWKTGDKVELIDSTGESLGQWENERKADG